MIFQLSVINNKYIVNEHVKLNRFDTLVQALTLFTIDTKLYTPTSFGPPLKEEDSKFPYMWGAYFEA